MTNSADPDQLASEELKCFCLVCFSFSLTALFDHDIYTYFQTWVRLKAPNLITCHKLFTLPLLSSLSEHLSTAYQSTDREYAPLECQTHPHKAAPQSHSRQSWPNSNKPGNIVQNEDLIVLGFNDTSTLVGHFVSSPREREKRDRRDSRGDERDD